MERGKVAMECSDVQAKLVDLLEKELTDDCIREVMEHMRSCDACRREYQLMQEMAVILKKGFECERKGISAPAHMEDLLYNSLNGEKKRGYRPRVLKTGTVLAVAAIAVFFILINVSPVVAYYLGQIPVVEKIVEVGMLDKGLVRAIEGDVGQQVEESAEKYGITLNIHEVVASANRTVVIYSIDWPKDINLHKNFPLRCNLEATNGIGLRLKPHGGSSMYDEHNNRQIGTWEFEALKGLFARLNVFIPEIVLGDETVLKGPWMVSFYVDKDKAREKQIRQKVDEDIVVEGGTIHISEVVTTASETVVRFEINPKDDDKREPSAGHGQYHSSGGVKPGDRDLNLNIPRSIKGVGGFTLVDREGREYKANTYQISNDKGELMFDLTRPGSVAQINVDYVIEHTAMELKMPVTVPSKGQHEKVIINGQKWGIKDVYRENDKLVIKLPVMEEPVEEVLSASLVDNDGKAYSLKLDWRTSSDSLEKVQDGKGGAKFYQKLVFTGVDRKKNSFTLIIEEAVVYTPVSKKINLTSQD